MASNGHVMDSFIDPVNKALFCVFSESGAIPGL